MDEPRDFHTQWSKPDREWEIAYNVIYMRSLKKIYKWTYLQNRDSERQWKQTYSYQRGKVGRDTLGLMFTHYSM